MIYHKTVLADRLTPVSAFLRVAGDRDNCFLLESVTGGDRIARYSFLGVSPERGFEGTFAEFRRTFPVLKAEETDLPPFTGGAVGVFSYDMVREFERIPGTAPARPVGVDFYSTILAFDHLKHQIVIISHEGLDKVEEIEDRLRRPEPDSNRISAPHHAGTGRLAMEHTGRSRRFCESVVRAKEYIRAGEIFQVVLSQRFEVDFEGNPFNTYRALRYINPSPYLFFIRRGDVCIAGSSPEMLVRVQSGDLEYRPIAGTRRRGRTPDEERALEQELLNDAKEKAEHLMLVDLGRNDLGRVCRFGSVCVEKFMFVEKYSHVMHLVSSLKGELAPGLNRFDALASCFPAGTVTGAPKVRAMEIIEELEPEPRGIYGGAIGYLDYTGNLDSCIAIRTILMEPGRAILQAGAGIVADSVPELEDKECHNKARVLFSALEMSQRLD